MTIVNLRGTNASGKSTVARALIGNDPESIVLGEYKTKAGSTRTVPGWVAAGTGIIVVGNYKTDCGGCDGIPTQDLVCDCVRAAYKQSDHVLFEGVIVSTIFARYLALSRELDGMVWAYLDTPLDVCLDRVYRRNGGKTIKEELMKDKINSIKATGFKAMDAGERVVIIDHKNAVPETLALFSSLAG